MPLTREDVFQIMTESVAKGMDLDFAARCAAEVTARIESGRSHDGDAWLALIHANDGSGPRR